MTMAVKNVSATTKKQSKSKSARAGLILPISRVNRVLKTRAGMPRIGGTAPVFLTALLEYLTAEVLSISGDHTKASKPSRKRISVEDVSLAIRGDEELAKLCSSFAVYSGDKITNISDMLAPKQTAKRNTK